MPGIRNGHLSHALFAPQWLKQLLQAAGYHSRSTMISIKNLGQQNKYIA